MFVIDFRSDRDFQVGSLSHFLNTRATGYQDLPPYPEVAPDPSVRYVEPPPSTVNAHEPIDFGFDSTHGKKSKKKQSKKLSFYSESEESQKSEGTGSESSSSSGGSTNNSSGDSESGTEDSESDSAESNKTDKSEQTGNSDDENTNEVLPSGKLKKNAPTVSSGKSKSQQATDRKVVRYKKKPNKSDTEEEETNSSSSSSDATKGSSSSDSERSYKKKSKNKNNKATKHKDASNVDLLLDMSRDSKATVDELTPPGLMGSLSGEIMNLTLSPSPQFGGSGTSTFGQIQVIFAIFHLHLITSLLLDCHLLIV